MIFKPSTIFILLAFAIRRYTPPLMKKSNLIHLLSGIIFSVIVYSLPLPGISEASHRCLAIFVWAIWMWISEALPLFVTGLAILFIESLILKPVLDVSLERFFSPFFSSTISLFMGGLVLADALQKYHVDELLAHKLLNRAGKKPDIILLAMIMATAFISMWMSNTAATAMMITIAVSVIRNIPADDPFRKSMILGIPIAANIGGIGTPVGTPPNAVALQFLSRLGIQVSFVKWMILTIPVMIILLFLSWRLLIYFFPAKSGAVNLNLSSGGKTDSRQNEVLAIFGITLLLWLTEPWHGLKSGVVALIPVILIFGGNLLNPADFRKIEWDILFLLGGGMTLGVAIEDSGLSKYIVSLLKLDNVAPFALFILITSFTVLLSTFISHTSAANILIPMAIGLGHASSGIISLGIGLASSLAMSLPISTPPNAIAFGSGQIALKDMVKVGLIIGIFGLALLASGGYLWFKLLKL